MTAGVGGNPGAHRKPSRLVKRRKVVCQRPSEAAAAIVWHDRSQRAHGLAGAGIAGVSVTVNGFL